MFDLNHDRGTQSFRKAIQEADDEGDSPFDRIEVSWPLPMLEVSPCEYCLGVYLMRKYMNRLSYLYSLSKCPRCKL